MKKRIPMRKITRLHLSLLALFLATAVVIFSCSKDEEDEILNVPQGKISGKVYSKSGKPMAGIRVFISEYPQFHTMSIKDGSFTLSAPEGKHTLVLQGGKGNIFQTILSVNVKSNQSITLTQSQTVLTQIGNLAYIKGAYDRIETIIIDSLGYMATELFITDLDSLSKLQPFQAIFLNCGKSGMLDSLKYANLENFVTGCGSIYASDWAVEYLTGDGNFKGQIHREHGSGAAIPKTPGNCVPKIGGFIPDSSLCTSKSGSSGIIDSIDIVYPALQVLLGKTKMSIHYDLGIWEVINLLNPNYITLLQDNTATNYGPLAVWIQYNTTCTKGGNIVYTTFHNEPYGGTSPDVMQILQFFIVNM